MGKECDPATKKGVFVSTEGIGKWVGRLLLITIIPAFAFIWTLNERVIKLESPEGAINRIKTLEEALLPVLVEYNLHVILEERGVHLPSAEPPPLRAPEIAEDAEEEFFPPPPPKPKEEVIDTLRREAKNRSYEQIQRPPEERK
jgi:hypothetical protein